PEEGVRPALARDLVRAGASAEGLPAGSAGELVFPAAAVQGRRLRRREDAVRLADENDVVATACVHDDRGEQAAAELEVRGAVAAHVALHLRCSSRLQAEDELVARRVARER